MIPLGAPVQIAYGVDDVDAAAARFSAATGAGPFFVVRHIALASARVHGIDGAFDHSSAYGQWGSVMVELVQEHTDPLVPLLDHTGGAVDQRIHHLAFMVADLGAARDHCVAQGWPEVLWATTGTGQEFAFCDARNQVGHLIEMYEPSPRLLGFYAMVAAAADGWDGSDPVRSLG